MAHGRGNSAVIAVMILLCMLVFHSEIAHANKFILTWGFGVANWPQGKTFKAGDIIEFHYNSAMHNVAAVDAAGYNSCTVAPGGVRVFTSGLDAFTLQKGQNYFISTFTCKQGVKIAVLAQ